MSGPKANLNQAPAASDGVGDGAPDTPVPTSEMFDQSWLGSMLRPLLIIIMVSCLALVLTTLISRFATDLPRSFFVGLALLAVVAATVGSITTTVLAQPSRRVYRSLSYRAAEVGLFLAITRVYVWFASGQPPDLGAMFVHPLDVLLDFLFIGAALVVGLSWFFAVEMTDDFNQLALRADDMLHGKPRHGLADESMRGSGVDRGAVLTDFTMRWVTLGLVMILLAALLRQGMSIGGFFGVLRQDMELTVLAPVILYFVAGLLLLSHGRLAQLRARWTLEQTPAQADVTRRWPWEVIALVGGVALLALLLPLGGTFWLATILGTAISVLFAFTLLLYRLAAFGILWLFSLFAGEPRPPAQNILPPTQSVTTPQVNPYHAVLPPWAGGAFFWSMVALLVAYAALVYLRDKGVRLAWLDWLHLALLRRWAALRAGIKRTQRRLNLTRTSESNAVARPGWFGAVRRNWADPNAQVRHLYLSTLRSAAAAGLPRHPGETPYGYAPRLAQALAPLPTPDAAPTDVDADMGAPVDARTTHAPAAPFESAAAMDALTNAFVEVRYAGSQAAADSVGALQTDWDQLQAALRKQRGDS